MPSHKPAREGRARTRRRSPKLYKFSGVQLRRRFEAMPITVDVRVFIADTVPFAATGGTHYDKQKKLERLFHEHAERWKKDTRHWSSATKMVMHTSYRRIMGMGPAALPLILRELRECPDHWFVALNAITGEDPAPPDSTFRQAADAWLTWGIGRGYLQ
jgi:hypothetical protein